MYPPGRPVGYERVIKFEKYLPEFGFNTCVLTVRSYGSLPSDEAKHVYRAFELKQLYRHAAPFLFKSTRDSILDPWAEQHTPRRRKAFKGIAFDGIRQWVLDWLAIPDMRVAWMPAAVLLGLSIIHSEHVDAILSSSMPETAHLVAACLAGITQRPWIADFRDGWLFESIKPALRQDCLRRHIEQRLERLVVSGANAVITVSQPITDYFQTAYPAFRAKFHTITNGYDPDDWNSIPPVPRDSGKLRIVYTGAFSISRPTQDPRPFLQALKDLEASVREKIEVLLVGILTNQEKDYLAALGLEGTVHAVGSVSKEESLAYQLSADVLLLIVGTDKSVATSKLFEYLYAGRPILAISTIDTTAAVIVTQTRSGFVVDPKDSQAIASCLTGLFNDWKKKELAVQPINIDCYHRQCLTQQLAGLLNTVITEANLSIAKGHRQAVAEKRHQRA
jgi:glycosyltransferase involved in cell wall biosynthesis